MHECILINDVAPWVHLGVRRTDFEQYPNSTYAGANSPDPVTAAGTKDFQASPPFYPSPWGSGAGDWGSAYTKARAFVSQLTLLEKVNMTTGVGYVDQRMVMGRAID